MRQIVLDTETTGLEPAEGHRIIEIGCIELDNRRPTGRRFHQYLQPDRAIDEGAVEVHGITNEFLDDKPRFPEIVDDLLDFLRGAELVIHNAPFDVGFLNHELGRVKQGARIEEHCGILDTLALARKLHPGQKNSLDALCKRYTVDNSRRELHGALLDAEILADVYLAMTGGQVSLSLEGSAGEAAAILAATGIRRLPGTRAPLRVIYADERESAAHNARLEQINAASGGQCLWLRAVQDGGGSAD